jgi:peptidoglycan/xylan/chitin deacetylase (PgdA/CDA1 family)
MWLAILALVIAGAAVLSHTAPAPFLFEAFRPSKSLWRVAPAAGVPPTIYLTFDDGPNPEWTPALLDALASEGVTATFFLIDEYITPETAPIVRRMAEDGHAIGLHTGKRWLMLMEPDRLAARLSLAADRIASITGTLPCRLFRPHAGWRSASMYEGLERGGYRLAGWSWGMWDWNWWQTDPERTARRLARKASAGDIIVIHDGHHKNPRADRRHTPVTIRLLVPALAAKGYSFGRLCDMRPASGAHVNRAP